MTKAPSSPEDHGLTAHLDGSITCSCGKFFPDSESWDALNHGLPIMTRALADQVAADPTSDPRAVATTEQLAQEALRISIAGPVVPCDNCQAPHHYGERCGYCGSERPAWAKDAPR